MAPRRHLLIAMDAFGTLFSPKWPIGEQYVAVARKFGISGLKSDDIHKSFYTSFKQMNKEYPNYGKKAGWNANLWWKALIENTFRPHISEQEREKLPLLVPAIINHFWCSDGYERHDDAYRFVQDVKSHRKMLQASGSVFFGVLSNSDTRLPDILRSFEYKVGNISANPEFEAGIKTPEDVDFQFIVLSYDVGHEKPAKEIFDTTESIVRKKLMQQDQADDQLVKLYVGDEVRKDGIGAQKAGWHAIVVDRANPSLSTLEYLPTFLDRLETATAQKRNILESVSSLNSHVS